MASEGQSQYYVWGHKIDRLESQRLTHQHYLCVDLFDGLLKQEIQRDLESRPKSQPLRIADVACGNCIWTNSVANSRLGDGRDLKVTGFDINESLWPSLDERAENVELAKWDIYKPCASEYKGAFDVVNIRLIQGAVTNNDPTLILDHLIELLKPGGWLQWLEFDFDNPIAPQGSPFLKIAAMVEISKPGHSNAWVGKMGELFERSGLRRVNQEGRLARKHMVQYWRDNWYIGILHLVQMLQNKQVDEIWKECEQERARKGMGVTWETFMTIGQKP